MRLILNPGSRSGRGRKLWTVWESGLRSAGIQYESAVTEGIGDAFRLSQEARDGDMIVAVGGDGTINEVLDGIVQSGHPQVRMGVLYSGTSPDFCRFHGIPIDPHRALRSLLEGATRPVDVARIDFRDQDGAERTAHFACGCNIGLGASVARFANRWRRTLGDGLGTCFGVIRAILLSRPVDLEVEIDGVALSLRQVNNFSVLKSPYIASGLKLNVDLQADDGKLMLVGVHGRSRLGLCALLPGFYSGRASDSKAVFIQACSKVSIRSAVAQEIEFDGDPRGGLPAEMRILPRALQLVGGSHG